MKVLISSLVASTLVGGFVAIAPEKVQAYFDDAWAFVCEWECGEAWFESEYGGYTLHGYASEFHEELPASKGEAADWAYYDFWQPAGCEEYSTTFSRTVCLDTAYLHGVGGWEYFESLYWDLSDDELACKVIDERAYWHNDGSQYSEGWLNRDAELAALGGCW